MRSVVLLALVACGGDDDPCGGVDGTCVAVRVTSSTIEAIDQLELDVLYGDRHGTSATQPGGGGTVSLPLTTSVALDIEAESVVGVVAAGKLAGNVLGTGAASTTVRPDARATIELVLAEPAACVAGAFYCGGDKLAGDPQTLYQCNGGGVPLARGRCAFGCVVRPTDDDVCDGGPMTCMDGGFYCGGNELAGDPSTLYRCSGGAGTAPMRCRDGCVIAPAGSDDHCR
ncbi:MAG: hypothetical protein H0T65_15260 [Deltaproteobacteria bacterium]|nr:hypothetical protein [Deltaproteobacteria bacterium]